MPRTSIAEPATEDLTEIRYLFRFRDLIAPTLEKHREIIAQKESCWWGWWKRPHEDHRLEVWEELQRATQEQPVDVGLFNSGTGDVYVARVAAVIPPAAEGDLSQVQVPDGERDLVPNYYRNSPFSRAWMRLVRIEPRPIQFFGRYSYLSAPPVPDYSETVLDRLRDKVITDPQELRSMDTTIWEVRPRRPADREEKILLTVRSLAAPISREPLGLPSNLIVHLTDPHFAAEDRRQKHVWRLESEIGARATLAEAVSQALEGRAIGLLVVTGDFTFAAKPTEYREAATSLRRLCGLWDMSMDQVVVVPGNHDILWRREDEYRAGAMVEEASEEAKENYRSFYRSLYGHEPHALLAMGRRFSLPCGVTVEVCGLNSSSLETGKSFLPGMGRIQENALAEVANQLGWKERSSLALRLLALHHHLTLTDNLEPAEGFGWGFGIAVDAPRVQRLAARLGVQLALHGHKHRTFLWRSGVYELPEHAQSEWRLGDLAIVGGGSAGSVDTEGGRNYFNLIEVAAGGLRLELFRAENAGSFDSMRRWEASFTAGGEPQRLLLDDWRDLG